MRVPGWGQQRVQDECIWQTVMVQLVGATEMPFHVNTGPPRWGAHHRIQHVDVAPLLEPGLQRGQLLLLLSWAGGAAVHGPTRKHKLSVVSHWKECG